MSQGSLNLYRTVRHCLWRLANKPFPAGPHITRFYMYEHFTAIGPTLPNRQGPRVLAISGSKNLAGIFGLQPSEVVAADYPDYNMLSLPFADGSFDYVLSDQVLEHIEGNPAKAAAECLRVLKPGGVAVHTTCFNMHVHSSDNSTPSAASDFWRFTPQGLRLLHDGCEILDSGGWGNPQVWSVVAKDGMTFRGVPPVKWHPMYKIAMKNDPLWPIVTWVIARK